MYLFKGKGKDFIYFVLIIVLLFNFMNINLYCLY